MINHPNFDYLAAHGEKGDSLIHFIARSGNAKMMNFLLGFIPSSKMEELINLQRKKKPKTPLNMASVHGKLEVVKVKHNTRPVHRGFNFILSLPFFGKIHSFYAKERNAISFRMSWTMALPYIMPRKVGTKNLWNF